MRLQLAGNIHRHFDRDGERQPHVTAGAAVDLRVHTHHFTVKVKQRATGISRVDCHVGLDERYIVFTRQRTPLGADNTSGCRAVETERGTDRKHPLTNFQRIGLANLHDRQIVSLDLQQRDVTAPVGADNFRLELTPVRKTHDHFVSILDHVVIGQNITVFGDNKTGTQRFGLLWTRRTTTPLAKEMFEQIAEG